MSTKSEEDISKRVGRFLIMGAAAGALFLASLVVVGDLWGSSRAHGKTRDPDSHLRMGRGISESGRETADRARNTCRRSCRPLWPVASAIRD